MAAFKENKKTMGIYALSDNTNLYYEIQGTGKPIVFIHGMTNSHAIYDAVVKDLKKDYMCVTYDARSHGSSTVAKTGLTIPQLGRDLKALIDYLDLKDVTLVGHSMGGATVYSYLDQFGCDNIEKVVIIDMSPCIRNDAEWKGGADRGQYTDEDYWNDMEVIGQNAADFMWRLTRLLLPAMRAFPDSMAPLMAPALLGKNDPFAISSFWHSMMFHDYRPMIEKITVPLLYVCPEQGAYTREAPEYIEAHSAGSVEIFDAAGTNHMLVRDAAPLLLQGMKPFLAKGVK